MNTIADFLMIAGTFGMVGYCYILAKRLKKFSTLDTKMGGAIAVLSAQVDELTRALAAAKATSAASAVSLEQLTARAEGTAARLEVLLATMHDLPSEQNVNKQSHSVSARDAGPARVRILRRSVRRPLMEAAE